MAQPFQGSCDRSGEGCSFPIFGGSGAAVLYWPRSQVVLDEHPRLSRLRSGEQPQPGAAPHFLGMHPEESSGLLKIKGVHGSHSSA